jgi:hypothetical protein
MKVNNINGTSQSDCKCGSWLKHWKNFSRQALPPLCPELSCSGQPEVGAHIQKDSSYDKNWYIVPLCNKHNGKRGESIDILSSTALVSANVSETCDK